MDGAVKSILSGNVSKNKADAMVQVSLLQNASVYASQVAQVKHFQQTVFEEVVSWKKSKPLNDSGEDSASLTCRMTKMLTAVIGLFDLSKRLTTSRLKEFAIKSSQECKDEALPILKEVAVNSLNILGWPVSGVSKNIEKHERWPLLAACIDWLLSVQFSCIFDDSSRNIRRSWATQLLAVPLRKRFAFHFLEKQQQTADGNKPDLPFRTVLNWISDHQSILQNGIQPYFDSHYPRISCELEFIRELSLSLASRTVRDLREWTKGNKPSADTNRMILELVDEIFAWTARLENDYAYFLQNESLDHVLLISVLPNEKSRIASYWFRLESAVVQQEMEDLLTRYGSEFWNYLGAENREEDDEEKNNDDDDSDLFLLQKPARGVVDVFKLLQRKTLSRLAVIPLAWARVEYVKNVYVPCLKQVTETLAHRTNLAAQSSESASKCMECLSSAHYIWTVLSEWESRPEFEENLLEEIAAENLERSQRGLHRLMTEAAIDFLEEMNVWITRNWLNVVKVEADLLKAASSSLMEISGEMCGPFSRLRKWIRLAQKHLSSQLCTRFALELSNYLDMQIFLLLSDGDQRPSVSIELAKQMAFDLNCVFNLWSPFTHTPRNLFKRCQEALDIFQMSRNELMAIAHATKIHGVENQSEFLEKFKIHNINAAEAQGLAWQRGDEVLE